MESLPTSPDENERVVRTAILPLPRSLSQLVWLVQRMLSLPQLQRLEVATDGVTVERCVFPNEEVAPVASFPYPDAKFILRTVQELGALHEMPFDPEVHPYLALLEATNQIHKAGLRPCAIVAPDAEWLSAFLGIDDARTSVFGMEVILAGEDVLDNRLVVLGGTSPFIFDASYGVIVVSGV
jgi:hypothetical protein